MSLIKRRSRSETRKLEKINSLESDKINFENNAQYKRRSHTQLNRPRLERMETIPPAIIQRQTSAELISEAKSFLGSVASITPSITSQMAPSVGGVRLVNTRRPITPREPGRALYGKVSLAGRPPSAFSLRYLQNETLRTTLSPASLEPIKSKGSLDLEDCPVETEEKNVNAMQTAIRSKRSNSLDLKGGIFHYELESAKTQVKTIPRKLPALEITGVAVAKEMGAGNTRPETSIGIITTKSSNEDDGRLLKHLNASDKVMNLLTSRKLVARNHDVLSQSTTEKLIELLKEHAGLKDCSDETVKHINSILVELYGRVRKNEKHFKRGFILGGLYGLVECSSPKILLSVARVVLALRVTGSNLTGACKLIFKVARNEENDILFHENDLLELLIDGLGRASPLDDPEACIYGYGSIRFLTTSSGQERTEMQNHRDVNRNWSDYLNPSQNTTKIIKPGTAPAGGTKGSRLTTFELMRKERYQKLSKQCSIVERLARHGAVELMVLHLQILNEAGASKKLTGPPLHSLYQLSAALRALADVRQTSWNMEQSLLESHNKDNRENNSFGAPVELIQLEMACPHLVRAAEVSTGELEVQGNIVRTLSILSEDEDCCYVLVNFTARIAMLLGPCCEFFKKSPSKLLSLFSRLGYILGNIMARYDNARIQFYHNDVAMEYLLNVMELNAKEPLTLNNAMGDTVIDVLIKMIRVVANMSVNSEVGFGLGNARALGSLLLDLLSKANQTKTGKLQNELQELLHATLGALHNLCFYQDKNSVPAQVLEAKGSLQSVLLDITTALCITLRTCNDLSTEVETARVLGNLTRNEHARKYFCKAGGLSLIVKQMTQSQRHQNPLILNQDNEEQETQEYDLKTCAIGVLVNLLGDNENREPFLKMKGAFLLLELLKVALEEHQDWFLASIVCQAFWNLLIDVPRLSDICDERILDEVCDMLADSLDENRLLTVDDEYEAEEIKAMWEQFAIVATDLLERIQNSFEQQNETNVNLDNSYSNNNLNHNADGDDDENDVYIEEM